MGSLTLPRVYPILDTGALSRAGADPVTVCEGLLEAGAEILQFRHKGFWDRDTFSLAETIARMCASVDFIVNDRADFAKLLNAGLHVGQDDLSPSLVRPLIGGAALGFSTHNAAQMAAAQSQPIDYVAFGPVFGTASKERPDPTTGLEQLRAVRALTKLPLVAIGGVTRANAALCHAAGADSVAVISDLLPQSCTRASVRERFFEWRQLS